MSFSLKLIKNKISWMIAISILRSRQAWRTKCSQVCKVKTRSLLRMKMTWYLVKTSQKLLISIWHQRPQGLIRVSRHSVRVSRIGAPNSLFRTNRIISTLRLNQGFKKCSQLLNLLTKMANHRNTKAIRNMKKP